MTQTPSSTRRIGVLGGSFDPIHIGHLIMAQDAVECLRLDEVIFVPTHQSPLKGHEPIASSDDRLDMIRGSIAAIDRFSVSEIEISSKSVSYSIETARALVKANPGDMIIWLIGADQAKQLADWRSIAELSQLVEFGIFDRDNLNYESELEDRGIRFTKIAARRLDISSTEIRERIKDSLPVNNFLPEPAFEIITSRNLYK